MKGLCMSINKKSLSCSRAKSNCTHYKIELRRLRKLPSNPGN